jgi:hypothetical protein
MFVNEFFFSVFLLSFAALLCLFGVVILVDGVIRLSAEWYRKSRRETAGEEKNEERVTTSGRAA